MFAKLNIATVGLIFSVTASAATDDIRASLNQISLQSISTYVDYTETGNGIFNTTVGTLDTETGRVPGVAFSVSRMTDRWMKNGYFEASYEYLRGYTKYIGAYHGGVYGSVVTTSSATISNYSIRFGKGFIVNNELMLTPYTELGHHRWYRGVNYGEIYNHGYYGIGGLFQYSPTRPLILSLSALYGKTTSSDIAVISGPSSNGFSGKLGNSPLIRLGIGADYEFDNDFYGKIGIELTSFQYGISDIHPIGGGYVAWEPDSTTRYTTIKLGIGRAF